MIFGIGTSLPRIRSTKVIPGPGVHVLSFHYVYEMHLNHTVIASNRSQLNIFVFLYDCILKADIFYMVKTKIKYLQFDIFTFQIWACVEAKEAVKSLVSNIRVVKHVKISSNLRRCGLQCLNFK